MAFTEAVPLTISAIALIFTALTYRRSSKAEKRAEEAHSLATEAARQADEANLRESVKFVHESTQDGKLTFRHEGWRAIRFPEFDRELLGGWEILFDLPSVTVQPGEAVSITLRPNRADRFPDTVRITWAEPFEGSQVVPVRAHLNSATSSEV